MKNSLLPYCERLNNATETVNVISNAGFLAVSLTAFYLLWRRASQSPRQAPASPILWALSLLPLLIGLGSAAYHHRPSNLTLALDLAPIGLFAAASLFLSLRHIVGYSRPQASVCLIMWLVATAIAAPWPGYFFGSLIYVPTAIAVMMVAAVASNRMITIAGITFLLALLMRSLDLPLCERLTTGTHPLWHLLAAFVSLLLLLALRNAMQIRPGDQ